ncbi:919_t:CDS:1, partial [Dentiscutata erythropus]
MENNGMVLEELEQNEDILESTQSNHNLEIGLIVDLSHVNFSEKGNIEEFPRAIQGS